MLKLINDLPPHVLGLHARADITETEYVTQLTPLLDNLVKKHGKISFILILETAIENFKPGAWCGNFKIGLKHFFKWSRVAIVSDRSHLYGYSDLFKYVIPGKFKNFALTDLDLAIQWVSRK